MDNKTKRLAGGTLDKNIQQVQELADAFGKIAAGTKAFTGPRDDYHGKRMPSRDWKKRQARKRMQKASRKAARP